MLRMVQARQGYDGRTMAGPTTLALPPFAGVTRKLILLNLAVFFGDAVLGLVLPVRVYLPLVSHLGLSPVDVVHGQLWQLGTYAVLPLGLLGSLFALLTLWFVGSMLEDVRGGRWLEELYWASAIGGAVIAVAMAYTRLFGLRPEAAVGTGPYAAIYGLLVPLALLLGDQEFLLLFIIRVKIKYLVAIYILIDLATLLKSSNAFGALLQLAGALCGYLFLRFVPRRGLASGVQERYFAMRNEYYRNKRRRAARKFEVYMKSQNREVHFDKDGRYVDPDVDGDKRDPADRRWMN